jgi:hypothetical protein
MAPPDSPPFTLAEIQSRLQSLTAYGCDIFVAKDGASIPPQEIGTQRRWTLPDAQGKEWYAQRPTGTAD